MAPARPRAAATDDDGGLVALHRARFVDWAPSPVVALAPTADAGLLAAARDDGARELWDVDSWACLVVSGGEGGEGRAGSAARAAALGRRRRRRRGRRPPPRSSPALMTPVPYHQMRIRRDSAPCRRDYYKFSLV